MMKFMGEPVTQEEIDVSVPVSWISFGLNIQNISSGYFG